MGEPLRDLTEHVPHEVLQIHSWVIFMWNAFIKSLGVPLNPFTALGVKPQQAAVGDPGAHEGGVAPERAGLAGLAAARAAVAVRDLARRALHRFRLKCAVSIVILSCGNVCLRVRYLHERLRARPRLPDLGERGPLSQGVQENGSA